MDTTPYYLLGIFAAAAWAGLGISTVIRVRRLRREDATQKGQNNGH